MQDSNGSNYKKLNRIIPVYWQ